LELDHNELSEVAEDVESDPELFELDHPTDNSDNKKLSDVEAW